MISGPRATYGGRSPCASTSLRLGCRRLERLHATRAYVEPRELGVQAAQPASGADRDPAQIAALLAQQRDVVLPQQLVAAEPGRYRDLLAPRARDVGRRAHRLGMNALGDVRRRVRLD